MEDVRDDVGIHVPITVGLDTETGQWQVVLRPTCTSLILWHAATERELAQKLSTDLI